jgi:hypothetical protein
VDVDKSTPCELYVGGACGPLEGYAQVPSICCGVGSTANGVVSCDSAGISLTVDFCAAPYQCMSHFGVGWKRDDGEEGIYSQCEKSD